MIRPARPADAAALAAVHLRAALIAYAPIFPADAPKPLLADVTRLWASTIAEASTFVADVDGRCAGGVAVYAAPDGPGWGHLRRLYVDPDDWGTGLGRELHRAALTAARSLDLPALTLWVLEENHRARAMYERWGWHQVDGARFSHTGGEVAEVEYRLDMVSTT